MTHNEIKACQLAVVGEAPGKNEEEQGKPFIGYSGLLLFNVLGNYGLTRNTVSFLNVSQHRPLNNDFNNFEWDMPEVQGGIQRTLADLERIEPNVVLACGNASLHLLTQGNTAPYRKAGKHIWPRKIGNQRGSVLPGFYPFAPKIVASYHPAYILRSFGDLPLFKFDVARAAQQSKTARLPKLVRNFELSPTLGYITQKLVEIRERKLEVSIDIEGGVGNITCIGIATSTTDAFIIPFGATYWTLNEETAIWHELSQMLADPDVPKILQNYLYDSFVLGWFAKTPVRGLRDDTMLAHWELFPELPKSLDLQCSIYTLQPYYKEGRKATGTEHLEYCLTDCIVTYECRDAIISRLSGSAEKHYRTNVAILQPFLYMQTKGIKFDTNAVALECAALDTEIANMQHAVNISVGCDLSSKSKDELIDIVANACCFKKAIIVDTDGLRNNPKAPWRTSIFRIASIIDQHPNIDAAGWGILETETGYGINVDSSKQMQELLYNKMGLPMQYRKVRGKRTENASTDALSMLTLYTQSQDKRLYELLRLRQKLDMRSALRLHCDDDGRMRCSYNVVGTETGRVSSYESAHGTGTNMQNRTEKHRKFWRADDGHWFFQCDLVGADGWTVAGRSALLGDDTMMQDYLAGAKPKNNIALMHLHGESVCRLDRAALVRMAKESNIADWLSFACKVVQHGGSYMMGAATVSDTILKLSFKAGIEPIYLEPRICERLLRMFFARYPGIRMWHRDCERRLRETGQLTCASGHTRTFFGRRQEHSTLKEFLAEEPQQNTTYLTNCAAMRLWQDPENRHSDGSLIVEPLHQVHDALCGQFPKDRLDFARRKLHEWFATPLQIGHLTINVPFDGTYGPSWAKDEMVGEI